MSVVASARVYGGGDGNSCVGGAKGCGGGLPLSLSRCLHVRACGCGVGPAVGGAVPRTGSTPEAIPYMSAGVIPTLVVTVCVAAIRDWHPRGTHQARQ